MKNIEKKVPAKSAKSANQNFDEPELWEEIEEIKKSLEAGVIKPKLEPKPGKAGAEEGSEGESEGEDGEGESRRKSRVISVRIYSPILEQLEGKVEPCKRGFSGGVAEWIRTAIFEKLEEESKINEQDNV